MTEQTALPSPPTSKTTSDTNMSAELSDLEFVAHVLQPIKVVVWGEYAMGNLGVPTVLNDYMLGVADDPIDLAKSKLLKAGFVHQNWSFSSLVDPATRQDDEIYKSMQASIQPSYAKFDANSLRFAYPDARKCRVPVVLIRTSYLELDTNSSSPASKLAAPSQPLFHIQKNLYFPNPVLLLESMIKVILKEQPQDGELNDWQCLLSTWAFGYLHGELTLRNDILDGSPDVAVKQWYDKKTARWEGGSNRRREKWGRDKGQIVNDLIKDFQISDYQGEIRLY